ncbi:neuronal acetylcholine receptor subunit alpha-5-like [Scylla paramamosain]|uniref:neuronal acetylcholine receptor subunit alpha-5-like n=1 Tax=Scylla paramamosain TaxID=85552 RepID=UPI003082CAF1
MMMMMMACQVAILCVCLLPVLPVTGEEFWRSETSLRKEVFQGYDKTIRPSLNVSVLVRSLEVDEMDVKEDAHAVLLRGALQLMWEDPRLRWRLDDHEDVDRLGVDPEELWHPDFAMASPAGQNPVPPRSQLPALVYPDGKVIFVPPVDLPLTCLLDLTYWPYDVLNCSLRAGSWVHHGHMLNVTLADDALKFLHSPLGEGEAEGVSSSSSSITRTEWEVVFANLTRHTQMIPCCSEPQVTLVMSMIVRRSAPRHYLGYEDSCAVFVCDDLPGVPSSPQWQREGVVWWCVCPSQHPLPRVCHHHCVQGSHAHTAYCPAGDASGGADGVECGGGGGGDAAGTGPSLLSRASHYQQAGQHPCHAPVSLQLLQKAGQPRARIRSNHQSRTD